MEQALRVDASVASSSEHLRAEIHLAPCAEASYPRLPVTPCQDGFDGSTLYQTFFHGPSLQVIARVSMGDGSVRAMSHPLRDGLGADLPSGARELCLARELALQTAAVHMLTEHAVTSLPIGADAIINSGHPRPGEVITAHAVLRDRTGDIWQFDIDVCGDDGRSLQLFRGLKMRNLGNFGQTTAPFAREAVTEP